MRKFAKLHSIPEATFRGWLKAADSVKLSSGDGIPLGPQGIRSRPSEFAEVEKRLVKYISFRREKFKSDKLGLSWVLLREKALAFASQVLGNDEARDFTASPGWCLNVLRWNGLQGVSLHGEGMKIDERVAAEKMEVFRSDLKELMTKKNIPLERVFNTDQTGLFY